MSHHRKCCNQCPAGHPRICASAIGCGSVSLSSATIHITGPDGFDETCTTLAGWCCVGPVDPGTYTVECTTIYGQTLTNTVVVGSACLDYSTTFRFYSSISASVSVTGAICASDAAPGGLGSASVQFGSYGTLSCPVGSTVTYYFTANPDPTTPITVTCTYRSRTTTQSVLPCRGAGFTFIVAAVVGVCGCGFLQDGASVTIAGPSAGTGTTDSSGTCCVELSPAGIAGDADTLTVTQTRFKTYSVVGTLGTVGSQTTITGTITNGGPPDYCSYTGYLGRFLIDVSLVVADGYHCGCCATPLADTLYWADNGGTVTVTFNDVRSSWIGCATRDVDQLWFFPAWPLPHNCAGGLSGGPVHCQFVFNGCSGFISTATCTFFGEPYDWLGVVDSPCDPTVALPGLVVRPVQTDMICPPAFAWDGSIPSILDVYGHCNTLLSAQCHFTDYRGGSPVTVTE